MGAAGTETTSGLRPPPVVSVSAHARSGSDTTSRTDCDDPKGAGTLPRPMFLIDTDPAGTRLRRATRAVPTSILASFPSSSSYPIPAPS